MTRRKTKDIVKRLQDVTVMNWEGDEVTDPICEEAANKIEQLRECLQHAIDHVGKWQLFTAEEKQTILSEYKKAVRGD